MEQYGRWHLTASDLQLFLEGRAWVGKSSLSPLAFAV